MTNKLQQATQYFSGTMQRYPIHCSVIALLVVLLSVLGAASIARFLSKRWRISEWSLNGPKFVPRTQTDAQSQSSSEDSVADPQFDDEKNIGELLPGYYDFEFLKRSLWQQHGEDVGILVVQYGSSVENPITAADEDYLVLLHGPRYTDLTTRQLQGHSATDSRSPFSQGLDIQVALYDSFWAGLIMGKPFEVSVAAKGHLRDSYNISLRYWDWLTVLCHNVYFDPEYLMDAIKRDIAEFKADIIKSIDSGKQSESVVSAYHLCCDYLKLLALRASGGEGPRPAIETYKLSQCSYLGTLIANTDAKERFAGLVSLFKHNSDPKNWHQFIADVGNLVLHLEMEVSKNGGD